ncbi:MAG: vanadium-dependent haloperoxidase [Chitinophagaceae bacterium]|nr:vanadium-dependent haloperoxidase [Chitinophagaceae bacterium]
MRKLISLLVIALCCVCSDGAANDYLNRCNLKLLDVIMEDIFSPPVAGRIQVYSNIAAYEVLCLKYNTLHSLSRQITHLQAIPKPTKKIDYAVAAECAFIGVAKKLVYSEHLLDSFLNAEKRYWPKNPALIQQSTAYAQTVTQYLFEWIKKDHYIETRTMQRYVLNDSLGAWKPTAPEYNNALEPNWPLIRSFVAPRSDYVKAIPNIPYSEDKTSLYYQNALAVYLSDQEKDSSKINTALYWDDNPNTAVVKGHATYFIHKVTPGGHWMKITAQALRKVKANEEQSAEVFTLVSIAIFEGFLSCWAEKFQSNSVRPETYINRLIDAKWLPLIETPPFPEYTSGHSVVSAAASSMLTHFFPKMYPVVDSSQMYLGLAPRTFKSFRDASDQASVSRFYGGIHYMPSLDNGALQGREVTGFILDKIKTRR